MANESTKTERKITVTFDTTVPESATDEQISEWLRFNLSGGSCRLDNPLNDRDIEANWLSIQVQ